MYMTECGDYVQTGRINAKMCCPHCGKYAAHTAVERMERKSYRWDDESNRYFKAKYGTGLSYRRRVRRCDGCGRKFFVVEMTQSFLGKLIDDVMSLSKEVEEYRRRVPGLEAKATAASAALRSIKRIEAVYDAQVDESPAAS